MNGHPPPDHPVRSCQGPCQRRSCRPPPPPLCRSGTPPTPLGPRRPTPAASSTRSGQRGPAAQPRRPSPRRPPHSSASLRWPRGHCSHPSSIPTLFGGMVFSPPNYLQWTSAKICCKCWLAWSSFSSFSFLAFYSFLIKLSRIGTISRLFIAVVERNVRAVQMECWGFLSSGISLLFPM